MSVGFSLLDVSCQVARFVTGQMFTRLTGGEVDDAAVTMCRVYVKGVCDGTDVRCVCSDAVATKVRGRDSDASSSSSWR